MSRYSRKSQKKKEPRWYAFLKAATDTLGSSPKLQKDVTEFVSTDHILMMNAPDGKARKLLNAWYDDCEALEPSESDNSHSTFVRLTNPKHQKGKVMLDISLMKKILVMMETTGEERITISVFQNDSKVSDDGSDSQWSGSMPALFTGPNRNLVVLLAPVMPMA